MNRSLGLVVAIVASLAFMVAPVSRRRRNRSCPTARRSSRSCARRRITSSPSRRNPGRRPPAARRRVVPRRRDRRRGRQRGRLPVALAPRPQAAPRHADNDWIRAAFYTGVMALHDTTKDSKYRDAAIAWGRAGQVDARARPASRGRPGVRADLSASFSSSSASTRMIAPFRDAIDRMIETKKPGRVDWWWCDALYMAPPALVRLSHATGDPKVQPRS